LAFFSKTNVMIKILHNLPLFWVKNANFFAEFFGENILIIITSVPGHPATRSRSRLFHSIIFIIFESAQNKQGCQMVCFQTKNPNLGKFWRALEWEMLVYLWSFGIF
jgi:hypothetical protein